MKMKKIKTKWLNFILHISSKINKSKSSIVDDGILKTLGVALKIIILEFILLVISLPVYIFISPERFSRNNKVVEKYRLKRIVSLVTVCTFIVIFLITTLFSSGVFLVGPVSELRADSTGWGFDNPKDYIYDSDTIQIVDGLALFKPVEQAQDKTTESISSDVNVKSLTEPATESAVESVPESATESVPKSDTESANESVTDTAAGSATESVTESAPESATEESATESVVETGVSKEPSKDKVQTLYKATIQPVSSMVVPNLASWDSFTESSSKNGGNIYYQLSDDNGLTWYYWNNKWVPAGENDYNTAEIISDKIKDFSTDSGQIMFKAVFECELKSEIQLLDITIAFSQKELADQKAVQKLDAGGLAANWSFNENSGSNTKDSTGINNGTIIGASWISGANGSALDFDGKGGHVEVPNSSSLDINGDQITMAAWFKITEKSDEGGFIFKNSQYFLRINNQGRVSFILYNPSWSEVLMSWDSRIQDNSWHHVAGVYDGMEMKLYLDGKKIAGKTSSGNIQSKSSDVWIGSQSGSMNQFDGILDEVQIYNKALSDIEVGQLFGSIKPGEVINKAPTANAGGSYSVDANLTVKLDGSKSEDLDGTIGSYSWAIISGPGTLTGQDSSAAVYNPPKDLTVKTEAIVELTVVDDKGESASDTAIVTVTPFIKETGSLVSKWKLDENAGTVANDSAGNNNGEIIGATWTTYNNGPALYFDGVNDYVSVNNSSSLNPVNAITVSAWIKWGIDPSKGNAWSPIINKNGDYQYQLQHNQNNSSFEFALKTTSGRKYVVGSTKILPDVWYLVVGTYDGSSVKLFVNGSLDTSTSFSGTLVSSTSNLNIGRRTIGDRYFNGVISDAGIWNYALSNDEISTFYREGNKTNTVKSSITIKASGLSGTAAPNIVLKKGGASGTAVALTAWAYDSAAKIWSASAEGLAADTYAAVETIPAGYFDPVINVTGIAAAPLAGPAGTVTFAVTAGENAVVNIANTANTKPIIIINSNVQQSDERYIYIGYTLIDPDSQLIGLSNYEYSLTGDFKGEESQMTIAASDSKHDGISALSSSAAGVDHTFVWDASADLPDANSLYIYIRLNPDDGIVQGEFSIIKFYLAGVIKPVVSGISATQKTGSSNVEIKYDLSGDSSSRQNVELEISQDAGNTWSVQTANSTGDIGPDISLGTGKTIIWKSDADFKGIDITEMQIRLRATDLKQNSGGYAYSPNFALDTKAPAGLSDFSGVSADKNSIVWSWTPVNSETNFKYYKIYYGRDLTDVQNATGTALVWDNNSDPDLSLSGTSGTVISGLSEETRYYAKIWAVDSFGNDTTIAESQFITKSTQGGNENVAPFTPILNLPQEPALQEGIIISGISEPGSDIDLYIDGEKIISGFAKSQKSDGKFTCTIKLKKGNYKIYVVSTDSDGNSSKPSKITNVKIGSGLKDIPASEDISIETGKAGTDKDTIVKDVFQAMESQILQKPQIIEVKGTDTGNNIRVTGKGIPNSEVVVFIHSEQVLIYRVKVNENGDWALSHSQNFVELAEGDHEVYAITLDAKSQVKSSISEIKQFQVKVNRLAVILSYFDLPTTLLTIFVLLIGIVVFCIWRIRRGKAKKTKQQI